MHVLAGREAVLLNSTSITLLIGGTARPPQHLLLVVLCLVADERPALNRPRRRGPSQTRLATDCRPFGAENRRARSDPSRVPGIGARTPGEVVAQALGIMETVRQAKARGQRIILRDASGHEVDLAI